MAQQPPSGPPHAGGQQITPGKRKTQSISTQHIRTNLVHPHTYCLALNLFHPPHKNHSEHKRRPRWQQT